MRVYNRKWIVKGFAEYITCLKNHMCADNEQESSRPGLQYMRVREC